MNVAIIGAGNGGQAFAAYFTHLGCRVSLYNRSLKALEDIENNGGIELMGVYCYKEKIHLLSGNIEEVIKGADLIMVAMPANAHHHIAKKMAPYLENGQVIILNPGRTFGTYNFMNVLKSSGLKANVILAETDTLVFTCRVLRNGICRIFSIKKELYIAAHRPENTKIVYDMLSKYFDILIPAKSVLFTGLSNLGVIFHPVPIILNVARIECKETFSHYQEGITPVVAMLLEKIDKERVEIARQLNIEVDSAVNWLNRIYKSQGVTLYEALQNNPAYTEVLAPSTIHNRYIYEDIETGLVPLSAIAHKVGVNSYTIDSIINLANILYDFDFIRHGRNESRIDLESIIRQTEEKNIIYRIS